MIARRVTVKLAVSIIVNRPGRYRNLNANRTKLTDCDNEIEIGLQFGLRTRTVLVDAEHMIAFTAAVDQSG